MRWSSAASAAPRLAPAVEEAAAAVRAGLDGVTPHLVVAFVSAQHASSYHTLPTLVRGALGGGRLVGCSAGAVIGGGRELEDRPGLSLTAAVLPDVELTPF